MQARRSTTSILLITTAQMTTLFLDNPQFIRLTRLTFPLNAFACATWLEEGQVNYLHYGLFDADHTSLLAAQGQSTTLILERLPDPGAQILEIGIGLGTTAARLVALGYHVIGIAPDAMQVAIAREKAGTGGQFAAVRFEDFPLTGERVNGILLQESAQYLNPTRLFSLARAWLRTGGEVLVLDQFALRRTDPSESLLHFGEDFVQHAEKQGFHLVEHLDLSAKATPTLDYLLRILVAHEKVLTHCLPIAVTELDQLRTAVAANLDRYRQGVLGYALYHFRLKSS